MQLSEYKVPKNTPVVNGRAYQLKLALKNAIKHLREKFNTAKEYIDKYGYIAFVKYFQYGAKLGKLIVAFAIFVSATTYYYALVPAAKFAKALIIALAMLIKYLTLGTIDGVIDLFVTKKDTVSQNLAKISANIITIVAVSLFVSHMVANATTSVAQFANPTLTASQKAHVEKSIELKKPVKIGSADSKETSTRLPNGDFMPSGIAYQDAKTLANTWNPNKDIKIVNKLFTGSNLTAQQEFFNKIAPGAQIAAASWGINPSVLMAQAAIESDFGRSTLASQYQNYFGIKYRGVGKKVNMPTTEYYDGVTPTRINDDFQVYDSIADSMSGNGQLLRQGIVGQPARYSGTWLENTKSYKDATQNGLQGKYATAPDYSNTLNKMIELYGLYVLDTHQIHNSDLTR